MQGESLTRLTAAAQDVVPTRTHMFSEMKAGFMSACFKLQASMPEGMWATAAALQCIAKGICGVINMASSTQAWSLLKLYGLDIPNPEVVMFVVYTIRMMCYMQSSNVVAVLKQFAVVTGIDQIANSVTHKDLVGLSKSKLKDFLDKRFLESVHDLGLSNEGKVLLLAAVTGFASSAKIRNLGKYAKYIEKTVRSQFLGQKLKGRAPTKPSITDLSFEVDRSKALLNGVIIMYAFRDKIHTTLARLAADGIPSIEIWIHGL